MKKFTIILITSLVSIGAHAQTWNCGTPNAADVKAVLSNDTLYIRGIGNMARYNYGPPTAPWTVAAAAQIRHIEVEEGITGIGYAAFCNLTNLVSVSFPTSLTSIASYSFMDCDNLLEVIIPENVTTLPAWAFLSCRKLEKIILPTNFSKLDNRTFGFANNIKELHILNPVPPVFTYSSDATYFPFYGASLATATLFVPCGSKDAYENAVIFQGFGNIEDCPQAGISNVKASFACPGQVTVTYDLGTTNPTDVTLYYSPDGGKTWLTAQTVSGDLTAQTTGASKTIVWDSRTDHVRWGNFKLKVEVPQSLPDPDCVMIDGVCWATRNVGAPGTFVNNPEDAGMYYQWNSKVGWSATDPLVSTDGSTWNWLWNGNQVTSWETTNNVCPSGYRLPTESEFQSLINKAGAWKVLNGKNGYEFGSGTNIIFLPATGYRDYWSTSLKFTNIYGYYWCGDNDGINTLSNKFLLIENGNVDIKEAARSYAYNLRCVKE